MKRRAIVWFRQNLRLHDNEALTEALTNAYEVIPVYVFDERTFIGKTSYGFPKTDRFRAQFIIESVADLRQSLQKLGSNLIVRVGKPEEEIFELAKACKTSWVFCNRERTTEELAVQDQLEKNLWSVGQEIRYSRGKMLYYTADLPFPVQHTPDVFTQFRKEVERIVQVREPLPKPDKSFNPSPLDLDPGVIPSPEDFGHEPFELDPRCALPFKGGETEALKRLKHYFWDTNLVKTYKETRNEMIGSDYSSKFSPWLAQGCLSPKMIYAELKRYEKERGSNESTYWLFFELLWRDFFRFMGKKHGNKIFQKGGPRGKIDHNLSDNQALFERWANGETGNPFIDANMRELNLTGFMSNRGRQNVASFLVKDLKVNWQIGAEYFESLLIDYDPCSNWGNWNYVAGVGSDPREDRYFNILTQARRYDPTGAYVKYWLPELADLPEDKIHAPDLMPEREKAQYGLQVHYPQAMISSKRWV